MKKTRTTAAEKLVILRNIMVQGKCAWNLKELERDGSKAGIVTQAIKDVLQSLCDDNLVDQDKIGSGSFFWSFSSKQQVRLEGKIKGLEAEKKELLAKQAELQARTTEASATRNSEDRAAKMAQYQKLLQERTQLQQQVAAFQENSPEKISKNEEAIRKVKAGVNRWTDNIWCTQSYCKKNFNVTGKDFWQNLEGVNDEIDNV